jgi:hypothetical protein
MKLQAIKNLLAAIAFGLASSMISAQSIEDVVLNVYKEPTCGCCNGWIDHMNENGYTTAFHHPTDIQSLKDEFGIKNEWRSCHTAVHETGYLFEGHIPEKFIAQFLASPPEGALGLAVPGMPLGGPGMEMGTRFTPYEVLLMNKDGSSSVFVSVKKASEQH